MLWPWIIVLVAALCSSAVRLGHAADIAYLRRTITDHFSKIRYDDVTNRPYKMAAKTFIFTEFQNMGLEAVYHDFSGTKNGTNVIGLLRGDNYGTSADRVIGLAAHYDTVAISPGVDDNGSGVAAMLNVAKQLTADSKYGRKRKHTILFVSFDLEEDSLTGSEFFISDWYQPHFNYSTGLVNQSGFIVMDTMMNYNMTSNSQTVPNPTQFSQYFPAVTNQIKNDNFEGNFVVNAYRNQTADVKLAMAFQTAWSGTKTQQYDIASFGLPDLPVSTLQQGALADFLRSDHANFWETNMPAIFLTDSANMRGKMQQCYHHACDNPAVMLTDDNLSFLAQTVDTLVVTLDMLSEASGPTSPGSSGTSSAIVIPSLTLIVGLVLSFFGYNNL